MVHPTLESAHAAVVGLVDDFAANESHYLSPGYSEAQVRTDFIDKFWTALGWDVQHAHQKNPYAQEVRVENPQKIDGSSRCADYAFFTAPDFQHPRFSVRPRNLPSTSTRMPTPPSRRSATARAPTPRSPS